MDLGVVTRSFTELTNAQTADLLAENGFRWTELCFSQKDSNYWRYNEIGDLSEMTDRRSREIVRVYRERGVEVTALGVFANLIESDPELRRRNLAGFERMLQIAGFNGVPHVATECGFAHGARGIDADSYEETFQRLVDSFGWLTKRAEHYGVNVALEPCVLDVVPSAKRAADLLRQVGSERATILLDPANLIANSSEEDMFKYLASRVAYFHGKDRKVNDKVGRVLGDGDIDWPLFLRLYHRHTEGVPFILEYVNAGNLLAVRDRVLAADRQALSAQTSGE